MADTVKIESNLPALLGINELRILEIKQQSQNLVIADTKTYDATKQLRTEVVTMRTTLEKKRKEVTKPYRDKIDQIKQEADRLKAMITTVEEPLQATVRAWEAKKEQEKKEREEQELRRKDALMAKIATIKNHGTPPIDLNSNDLKNSIEACQAIPVTPEEFQEFLAEAQAALTHSVELLKKRLRVQEEFEERNRQYELEKKRQKEEAEYIEELRLQQQKKIEFEKECREIIGFYANFPASLVDKTAQEAREILIAFEKKIPDEPQFHTFFDEALNAFSNSLEVGYKMMRTKEQNEKLIRDRDIKEEISKLYRLPTNARAFPSSTEVQGYLIFCQQQEPKEEKYGTDYVEAHFAWRQSLDQIEEILRQKLDAEAFLREEMQKKTTPVYYRQEPDYGTVKGSVNVPDHEDHDFFIRWCDEIKTAIGHMPEFTTSEYFDKALTAERQLFDVIQKALSGI